MGRKNLGFSKSLLLAILLCCSLAGYSKQVTLTASSGTASGTFTTLKGAFDAINAGTHQGAIVININASTSETASAVLNASGSGSASYSGISIYPTRTGLSIASINTSLEAPLIDLNGADNVNIDGRVNATGSMKSLTVSNTSTSSTAGTLTSDDAAGEIGPRLYPNPARSADVKLSMGSLAPGRYEVQVLVMSGRLVLTKSVEHKIIGVAHNILGKEKLASGLYTLILIDQNKQPKETLRLVVD